jgi:prepilin-type N-terminal cleavage/methylation domain-containing protein
MDEEVRTMNKRNAQHCRRGFTLVELLTVIGIMALVAAVTVMAVAPMMRGQSLSTASQTLTSLIYQTRTYAVMEGANVALRLQSDPDQGLSGFLEYWDPDLGASGEWVRLEQPEFLPDGVEFVYDPPVTGTPGGPGGSGSGWLVFAPSGGLLRDPYPDPYARDPGNPPWPGVTGNRYIVLQDTANRNQKVIEIIFASGMTRSYDQ